MADNNDLRIWQDLSSNGETDAGELQTLGYWGINQISLATTATEQIIANNELRAEAIFSDGEAVNKRIGERRGHGVRTDARKLFRL